MIASDDHLVVIIRGISCGGAIRDDMSFGAENSIIQDDSTR